MTRPTPDDIAKWKAEAEAAAGTDWRRSLTRATLPGGAGLRGIAADIDGAHVNVAWVSLAVKGSAETLAFIASARTAVPALCEEVERLRALVYRLSDALTDEGPDWSDDGLANLRADVARALPDVEWLQEYSAALGPSP